MGQPSVDQPQGAQMDLHITKVITYPNGIFPPVRRIPDGGKILTFITPLGEQINFPMTDEIAKQIGSQLMAPGIEIASAVPPNGARPPFDT